MQPERISRDALQDIPVGPHENPKPTEEFIQQRVGKLKERRKLLEQHPELKIGINPQPLKEILPGSALICYAGSSVARDEAVRGSDIDGAVVVCHRLPSFEQQGAYINALRKQGFRVYTHQQAIKLDMFLLRDRGQLSEAENFDEITRREAIVKDITLKAIWFETFDEFEMSRRAGTNLVHNKFFIMYADDDASDAA